ncbi:hypothetical protein PMAYCL1PPCAC_10567 [Pristionchus mayeri]|uniref:Uncharacterized protein n=1 Tax=Pristionchus mayeri TaxID=1317129 RepID=A0AAN4ZFT1_9BILA|nr:hypothetical protein PMAYCL1PPCAC_10567 [Pristionchus mayeri]
MEALRRLFCCSGPNRDSLRRKAKLLREFEQTIDDLNQIANSMKLAAIQALNSRQPVDQVRETLANIKVAVIRKLFAAISLLNLTALADFDEEKALDTTDFIRKLDETIDIIFERTLVLCNPAEAA